MSQLLDILLQRCDTSVPWGLRIEGGNDSALPATVISVTPGTLASQHLSPGDLLLQIQKTNCEKLKSLEIIHILDAAHLELQLLVNKVERKKISFDVNVKHLNLAKPIEYPKLEILKSDLLESEFQKNEWFKPQINKEPIKNELNSDSRFHEATLSDWTNDDGRANSINGDTSSGKSINFFKGEKSKTFTVDREIGNIHSSSGCTDERLTPIKLETVHNWRNFGTEHSQSSNCNENSTNNNWVRGKLPPIKGEVVPDWRLSSYSFQDKNSTLTYNEREKATEKAKRKFFSDLYEGNQPIKAEIVPDWRLSSEVSYYSDEDDSSRSQVSDKGKSAQEGKTPVPGAPPPPPPPGMPGILPSRRLQSEIPERGSEPPAAIQNAMMTKDKKPFTYTPGGLDLSEIKSPRMARRVNRNAQAQEIHGEHAPAHQPPAPGSLSPAAVAAMQPNMPTQVFPTGPPPPPPPPPSSVAPPPPPSHAPKPPSPPSSKVLPKIRGFDPNEILQRASRLQPETPPTPPAQKTLLENEPGSIYIPPVTNPAPRAQLGSIYIPPVQVHSQDSPTLGTTKSSPSYSVSSPVAAGSPTADARRGPAPWMSQRPAQAPAPTWTETKPQQSQQQGGARIIPIQIEGREPAQVVKQQSQQQHQQQTQPSQQPFQQQSQQPKTNPPGTRVIPIQIEGAATSPSNQQQQQRGAYQPQAPPPSQHRQQFQQKYNPVTPSSPTPYTPPSSADGASQAPQWAPVQPRMKAQEQSDRGNFLPPLGPQTPHGCYQPEYGNYNTAGVPLSALRKMQLSDEDKALMEKLKTQAEKCSSDQPTEAEVNPLYKGAHIPSRVFKILDESVDDETYLHRESDPRYRGAAIPSRAFRMLQTMTDTAGEVPPVPRGPSRGPPNRPASTNPYQQEAGPTVPPSEQQVQEPRKYTGGSIPSRSFRMLQAMTGQDPPARGRASSNSPSGRDTPIGRWCPSPASTPMDPYWGYYPPDPYMYYNYISDLNAAYGYPSPPPPPPPPNYPPPPSNYPPPPPSYLPPAQNYPPLFAPQRFPNYMSDNDENGYSSTDELGQYYQNYRRSMGYPPYPMEQQHHPPSVTPKPKASPKVIKKEPEKDENFEEESTDESVSSSDEETDTDDTEIEEEKDGAKPLPHKVNKQGSLQALKSVSDVHIYTSESTATVTNDEWEDCESKLGDEDQDIDASSHEGEGDDGSSVGDDDGTDDSKEQVEEIIPHQLSVIFEESEHSDVDSIRKADCKKSEGNSVTSESEGSTTTLDNCLEDEEEEEEETEEESDDDANLLSESSVTVRLPLQLKFSKNADEDVTTVIVGDSEVKRDESQESSQKDKLQDRSEEFEDDQDQFVLSEETEKEGHEEKQSVVEESDEYKSDEADVSFTFSIPTRSNSVVTVLSTEDELRNKAKVDVITEESPMEAEVTVSLSLPKKNKRDCEHAKTEGKKIESFSSWIDKNNEEDCERKTEKTDKEDNELIEEKRNEETVGQEDMISTKMENTREERRNSNHNRKLNKKDSKDSVEESEEDDSGVTSDMSNKPQNSETDGDTESEFTELNKMTQYQRASTHSRLFKLLQEECEKDDIAEEEDDDSKNEPITSQVHLEPESIHSRREKMTLSLITPEVESQSSSSGVTSPSSPTVTDRLVKELIQSLLHKKKGKKFRKLPMAKLHAAALRILQEDMDPYDTSSASASGDDGFAMSPVRKATHSLVPAEVPPPLMPESVYGENYYDYLDYYNSWGPPTGYYNPSDYDIMPSRAFHYLNHPGGYSPGFKPKCPRVPLPGSPAYNSTPTPTQPYIRHYEEAPEVSLSFSDKRERVAKVLEKPTQT